MSKQAFPLCWPPGWPRTTSRGNSQFKTSVEGAINNVEKSIKMFASDSGKKVDDLLISTNYSLTERTPKDPGVAVYFTWDGISTCMAVDRYSKLQDNLQALHHCIEAERTKLRHGGLALVQAAFRGYAALPPPVFYNWRKVLGVGEVATLAQCEKKYKERAVEVHPDKNGGNEEPMKDLNAAMAEARKFYG